VTGLLASVLAASVLQDGLDAAAKQVTSLVSSTTAGLAAIIINLWKLIPHPACPIFLAVCDYYYIVWSLNNVM